MAKPVHSLVNFRSPVARRVLDAEHRAIAAETALAERKRLVALGFSTGMAHDDRRERSAYLNSRLAMAADAQLADIRMRLAAEASEADHGSEPGA